MCSNNSGEVDKSDSSRIQQILRPSNIRKGVLIFIIITLLAFTGLFVYTNSENVWKAFLEIDLRFIVLSIVLAFLDWLIGGWRNHIFIREVKPGISQWACFDANLANIFVGAVTPSQTGGGPAQWYILHRRDVKIADSIAVSTINYVSTIIFFIISGAWAIYHIQNLISSQMIINLIRSAFIIFGTGFLIIFISLLLPNTMGTWFIRLSGKIERVFRLRPERLISRATVLKDQLLTYHDTMMMFIREKFMLLPVSLIVTVIMYLNKYTLAYVLLLGMGVEADYMAVITIQAVIFFILYFAPSPGGSGFAELSIAVLMAQIIIEPKIATFTILHRSFLMIIPALIGAYITLKELKRQSVAE